MKRKDFSNTETKSQNPLNLRSILISVGISYLTALLLFLLLAVLITYTSFKEEHIKIAVIIINYATVMLAAILVCKNASTLGWLNGGTVGAIYMILLLTVGGIIIDKISFNMSFVLNILLGFVFGAIGGIIGINLKN